MRAPRFLPSRLVAVEPFGADELLAALRGTRLRGFGGAHVYGEAHLELSCSVQPAALTPAQRYVLRPGVARILALRTALLEHGIDLFALQGGVRIRTADAPDQVLPVIPPVVEESCEPSGRTVLLINDGIHRVYAARSLGVPISVVTIRGVAAEHPYYAFALPNGWADVTAIDALPEDFDKKTYRQPDDEKALFREFNAVFPGVQPEHLASG